MKFDLSKVIENPTSLPDGEYLCADTMEQIQYHVENNYNYSNCVDGVFELPMFRLGSWKYYYLRDTHTNTHRTKHRRVLAPLWERTKGGNG